MTPIEKAKDLLFNKFGCKKQYALNAVDEILKYQPYDVYSLMTSNHVNKYWAQVKQEIEKL